MRGMVVFWEEGSKREEAERFSLDSLGSGSLA